jgi:hypothetical protein
MQRLGMYDAGNHTETGGATEWLAVTCSYKWTVFNLGTIRDYFDKFHKSLLDHLRGLGNHFQEKFCIFL